jgi:hypothetical protein
MRQMELFLNIVWALIALCALYVWRMHWARQKACTRRTPVQQWTAFTCGLVLLFFAVSLTDDLHSEIVLFDECASGRRYSVVCTCAHAAPDATKIPAGCGVAILPGAPAPEQLVAISTVSSVTHDLPSCFRLRDSSGRSPPPVVL